MNSAPSTNARIGDLPAGSIIRSHRRHPRTWLVIGPSERDSNRIMLRHPFDAARESSLPRAASCWHIIPPDPAGETDYYDAVLADPSAHYGPATPTK